VVARGGGRDESVVKLGAWRA